MTRLLRNDGLLKAGNFLTVFVIVILALVAAVLLAVIPYLLIDPAAVADEMVDAATASVAQATMAAITALTLSAGLLGLGCYFLFLLRRIILSVGEGDPFIDANASRLTRMGWIALAIEVGKLPLIAIVAWMMTQFQPTAVEADLEFSLTGLLLALVLFILARVFRHGAAMRADLEGTV
ncbi:DUF2975 domain-containing protein [Altererythrobacter sp. BO-6]|uniref:DUF2975 domain-containing protein n=1 Tax=Altererythrobacter sp. BO-6 TaxID=2604537 RepID=UPI0013E1AFBC|nr:DUF2975 domain-containing protein [Altererythrobacter sp. BO-6]QIG54462.1 DUF2975 domain-containing protein [Altererythrobacter sp. BO-6]